ncbi:MAG: cellulose biosynthesis protein BcsG [Deltaproteobacteria bacterium]|nr:cellulose biosynthesis protein BcsG [Deltaproteobacteria bacterium]
MGVWIFYFLAKTYLFYKGYIRLDVLWNLIFMGLLIIPLPKGLKPSRLAAAAKAIVAVILGSLLLWHDSWLPSPLESANLLQQQGIPTKEYIFNFLLRYYNPVEMAILSAILAFCIIIRNYRRLNLTGTVILIVAAPFLISSDWHGNTSKELDKFLEAFYEHESSKFIYLKKPKTARPDFDIVILNICSLAWDDLEALNLKGHPLFKEFDYLFTNFNSVSAYSNPSAIRLLRSNCGQTRHGDLYNNVPANCSIMESLRVMGYETYFLLNHNGQYGNFTEEVKRLGNLNNVKEADIPNLPTQLSMFDDSPVYNDYSALERWWSVREKSKSDTAALYYNSVTLHDGVHNAGEKDWWKMDQEEQYKKLLPVLLDDMARFLNLLESSGRNIVVIFIPEHGRAVHGSAMQKPGFRDIPLPDITNIPVGVKLIGKFQYDRKKRQQVIIHESASYFAAAYMLASFIEKNPFKYEGFFSRRFINAIPRTDFVAENEVNIVIRREKNYFLYGKDKKWLPLH